MCTETATFKLRSLVFTYIVAMVYVTQDVTIHPKVDSVAHMCRMHTCLF